MESSATHLSPVDSVQLTHGLSLVPRLRVLLSFIRSDLSVKPVDDWQLKESLKDFIKEALSVSVLDKDLFLNKDKDLHKRGRDESVASGVLYIWDLQAVGAEGYFGKRDAAESSDITFRKTMGLVADRLNGIELHIGGLKLRCKARLDDTDDFDSMKHSWQAVRRLSHTDYQMENPANNNNTLIIGGVPSRWFAEPRVSSKASVLVTHSIFSQFGLIRNLDIREDDLGRSAQNIGSAFSTAFSCHAWVQYEQYSSFYNAMKALCGRSMLRQGSSFKANYELSWDKDGYFTEGNIRKRRFEKEKIEEQRRWQLFNEARKAEIALRQAELARLEQEKREMEQMQQLRDVEEKRKQERDTKTKEEMRREKQADCIMEEDFMLRKEQETVELVRKQRLLWDKGHPEKDDQQKIRRFKETPARVEQKRQSGDESVQQMLQTDEDITRFDHHQRRSVDVRHFKETQKRAEQTIQLDEESLQQMLQTNEDIKRFDHHQRRSVDIRHFKETQARVAHKIQLGEESLHQMLQTDEDIARFDHHLRRSEGVCHFKKTPGRAEQKRQSSEGSLQQMLRTDEDIVRFDQHQRRSEDVHHRHKEEEVMEEDLKKSQHGHREMSRQHLEEEGSECGQFERWVLLDNPSALVPKVKTWDVDKADDHAVALLHANKRLRSIIVDSRTAFLPVDS